MTTQRTQNRTKYRNPYIQKLLTLNGNDGDYGRLVTANRDDLGGLSHTARFWRTCALNATNTDVGDTRGADSARRRGGAAPFDVG